MLDFHLLFLLRALLLTTNVNAQGNGSAIEVPVDLPLLLKAKGEGVRAMNVIKRKLSVPGAGS